MKDLCDAWFKFSVGYFGLCYLFREVPNQLMQCDLGGIFLFPTFFAKTFSSKTNYDVTKYQKNSDLDSYQVFRSYSFILGVTIYLKPKVLLKLFIIKTDLTWQKQGMCFDNLSINCEPWARM